MRRQVLVASAMAVFATSAAAMPANENEAYYLGDYAVRIAEGDKPTKCRVQISWFDDVGGEIAARGCEAWPDLTEATRWWFDAEHGEAKFEDAVHQLRLRVAETDAGFVAILRDDTHLWLEALPKHKR